jgi:N-ethylmaleimide reductase
MKEKMILFEKFNLAGTNLANRIVMAPMTRCRADRPELSANKLIAEYYSQRATAGLIITEGSQISPQGYGYSGSPGCYSQPQTEGWKIVTKAVHAAGGKIFLQLWHVGPYSHRQLQPDGNLPLSASAVQPTGVVPMLPGRLPYDVPKPMTLEEIYQTIRDFGQAAQNAMTAGFDGVEIHGAHAYVIDQFLMDCTNHRTDDFGGSVANRAEFLFLIIKEILKHLPSEKVGLRLSPDGYRPGLFDSDARNTFSYIIGKLNDYRLAYLHINEQITTEERIANPEKSCAPFYRNIYRGTLLSCGGHSKESARRMLDEGHADLIVFGKPFISNPDLVERLRINAPLAEPDRANFYHGEAHGYTDYPILDQTADGLD